MGKSTELPDGYAELYGLLEDGTQVEATAEGYAAVVADDVLAEQQRAFRREYLASHSLIEYLRLCTRVTVDILVDHNDADSVGAEGFHA
jgi:hypothetical protein